MIPLGGLPALFFLSRFGSTYRPLGTGRSELLFPGGLAFLYSFPLSLDLSFLWLALLLHSRVTLNLSLGTHFPTFIGF